jgi:hypothetical protein
LRDWCASEPRFEPFFWLELIDLDKTSEFEVLRNCMQPVPLEGKEPKSSLLWVAV